MKTWRVLALSVAMTCSLLGGCGGGEDRARAERVRSYFRQDSLLGTDIGSFSIPTSWDLQFSFLGPSRAGALAGALGLEWPQPPSDAGGPRHRTSAAEAYCSWNWAHCLLALSSHGEHDSNEGTQTRLCLIDTTGHVSWTRDILSQRYPVISDSGTVALFTLTQYPLERQLKEVGLEMAPPGSNHWADATYRREYGEAARLASGRDSFITTFVSPAGKVLGRWACPRSQLITAGEWGNYLGVVAFMPGTDRLFMLMNPRKKYPGYEDTAQQYIRCLRTDGSVEWQYDLGASPATVLAFPGNGDVIAFGTREIGRMQQSGSRLYDNELFVFDTNGHLISHIERRSPQEIDHSWLAIHKPPYLYFLAERVEVLDLESGKLLTQVPLRSLYDEYKSDRMMRAAAAERLLRRQLKLSVRDTIPPLQ